MRKPMVTLRESLEKVGDVKLVVHQGKLVAVKMKPRVFRMMMKATLHQPDADARGTLLLAGNDKHTPQGSVLHLGAWLGAKVYLDVVGLLEGRMRNGDGHE